MRALVVFFDPVGARWEWALKVGFRHVFCVLESGDSWIMIDARDGRPVVEVVASSCFDLQGFYEEQGYSVIEMERPDRPLRSPVVTVNCVGLVCAHLCIRAPFAFTPWQLFKHLKKEAAHALTRFQQQPTSSPRSTTAGRTA